jgi:hypothetical protein
MSDQNQGFLSYDWSLLFYWMMATAFGWVLGWLILPAVALVTAGVGAGVVQAVVLYRRIPKAWQWILASTIGWMAGMAILIPMVPAGAGVASGAIMGATAGTAQWSLLRRHVSWAGWWIAVSAVAWSTGMGIAPASGDPVLPRIVLAGAMAGIMTGTALTILMRFPKSVERIEPSGSPH